MKNVLFKNLKKGDLFKYVDRDIVYRVMFKDRTSIHYGKGSEQYSKRKKDGNFTVIVLFK